MSVKAIAARRDAPVEKFRRIGRNLGAEEFALSPGSV
jgi:hypothetical protein